MLVSDWPSGAQAGEGRLSLAVAKGCTVGCFAVIGLWDLCSFPGELLGCSLDVCGRVPRKDCLYLGPHLVVLPMAFLARLCPAEPSCLHL